MNILKILGIVAGIHVVAFFLMFVNPGCRSTSTPPTSADTLPVQPAAPAAAATDTAPGTGPAVSVSIPNAPVRYSPTRPGTPESEALENTVPADVTPASTYTVVRGDSLSKVAKKNHTSVAELMKTNHLTNSSILNVGQKLIIPGKTPEGAAPGNLEPVVAGASYTVKPGDTLASIAHRCGSTTAELKKTNNLQSDYVQVGRELKLPAGSAPVAAEAAPGGPVSVKAPEGALTHEVKVGETVGVIARKYHVKTQDLLVANNIADPRKIRPGQVLVIPGGSAPAAGAAAKPGSSVKPSPATPAGPAPETANGGTSVTAPAPAAAPDLDSGMKPQADVPVIKVDDSSDTKTP
jgi:LysM repeat protein